MEIKIFSKPFTIAIRAFNKPFASEVTAFVTADMIFAKSVMTAFTAVLTPLLRELTIAVMRVVATNKTLKKKAAMETRIFSKPAAVATRTFLIADATFPKNIMVEYVIFTKNTMIARITARKLRLREAATAAMRFFMETKMVTKPILMEIMTFLIADTTLIKNILMADITARKPRLTEDVVKTMRFAKPVITETTDLMVKLRSFEKKATMETRMVIRPVLMATKDFMTARAIARRPFSREVTIATIRFIKPVNMETASFTLRARVLEKNACIEARIVNIPVLIEATAFLMADKTARKARLQETIIEAINLTKPVIRERMNFLIDVRIFEKKVTMEARMVMKPVLMATGIFLMADMVSTKNFLMP